MEKRKIGEKKINLGDLEHLKKILIESWCKETCYSPDEDKWSANNPAFGQCLVTSLIVQDYFGGVLCYCKHQKHYWNRIGNKEVDLTILSNPEDNEAKTPGRYFLLKSLVEKKLKNV